MTLRRKLGGPERAWGLSSSLGSVNTLRVAHLRGPLTRPLLETTFAWLQKKHPLLQVRVEEVHGELAFSSEGVGAIPVTWESVANDEAFNALCERLLNEPIDWTKGPLARVVGVENAARPGRTSVLLAFHHAVNDSTSSTQLVTQMLGLLARLARGETIEEPETLPLLAPSDRLLPDDFRGLEGVSRVAGFLYRQVTREFLMRPLLLRLKRDVQVEGPRTTHMLCRTLTETSTRDIEEAARAQGTTVQGALCAAMLLAGYRMAHVHLPAVNYRLFSFVNMRSMLEPPVHKESVGCYVSMIGGVHRVGPDREFWDLARECKRELDDAILRGDALSNVAIADKFIDFVSKRGRHTLAAMTVSNIGRLPFEREYGPFTLENLQAASAMNGVGACCAAIVSTLHGRLSWTFTYVKPFFENVHAERYFDLALEMLCEACGTLPALVREEERRGAESHAAPGRGEAVNGAEGNVVEVAFGVNEPRASAQGNAPQDDPRERRDPKTRGRRKEARTPLDDR